MFTVHSYVSCVVGCPYEGSIAPKAVAMVRVQTKMNERCKTKAKILGNNENEEAIKYY